MHRPPPSKLKALTDTLLLSDIFHLTAHMHSCVTPRRGAPSSGQQTRSPTKRMDLVTLWERVPPLLDACVQDNTDASRLRTLRLVSKEASRVALLALRSYTLVLTDGDHGCRSASGASLLQHTRLQTLNVQLRLTGRWRRPIVTSRGLLMCLGPKCWQSQCVVHWTPSLYFSHTLQDTWARAR